MSAAETPVRHRAVEAPHGSVVVDKNSNKVSNMGMWFPHLHVASAFSAHYGVARPEELAETAAGQDAQILACTDRDGLYLSLIHI